MKKVTVGEMVESLLLLDQSLPLEISVLQYNKKYPVAYCNPNRYLRTLMPDIFAVCVNGNKAMIKISLPSDENSYMITSTRKK